MGIQNIVHKNSLYLLSTVIRYKINYIMIFMRPAAASTKTRNSAYNYSIHYIIAHKIHIPKVYLINYKTESVKILRREKYCKENVNNSTTILP